MGTEGKEIIAVDSTLGVMTIEYLAESTRQLEQLYTSIMKPGVDYGIIPGTERPTLLKSGAELLRLRGRLDAQFAVDDTGTNLEKGIFFYRVVCSLYRDGVHIGDGVGSCSSLESKYRYRWLWPSKLPKNFSKAGVVTRTIKVKGHDVTQYRQDNDNPHDVQNTVLKMGKKRSFIDAILTVTGASRIFTQDVEDFEESHMDESTHAQGHLGNQPTQEGGKLDQSKDKGEDKPSPSEKKPPTGKKVQNVTELKGLLMKHRISTAHAYEILSIKSYMELVDLDKAWEDIKKACKIDDSGEAGES